MKRQPKHDFLARGGEMGERMRALDWSKTPLGPPARWPQSLKTAVRIMLTSRQPFWIGYGPELTYLYNDPYLSIIGGKHPAALGQPFSEVWKEIWDVVGPMAGHVIGRDEGTYVESQLLIMERFGYSEETYYTFSYSPIPGEDGRPGGLICANTDDTRRVIGERQLATLRELAARTANARTWQDACVLGAQALATNGRDLPFAVIYMEGKPAAAAGIDTDRAPKPPLAGDFRAIELDASFGKLPAGAWPIPPTHAALVPIAASSGGGRSGMLLAALNPFRKLDESYRGFLELAAAQIASAIANAQAYEEERKRAESLAELDRAKTTFFSNVSHEFRTPLTLLLGPVEDALSDAGTPLPAAQRERLELVRRNGLRLQKLVNSLLDFSRIEAGRAQVHYLPTQLGTLTTDLASSFRSAIEKAGLQLVVDCPTLPDLSYVDRDMWEKIVLNLLSNALKFTFQGAITVSLRQRGDRAELAVRDTGTGIPAAELPRVFERFHRIEGAKSRTHEGTGIGLALVRELVKLHGGTIAVESEPGAGTTFTVSIPQGRDHLPAGRVASEAAPTTALRAEAFVEEALRWLPDEPEAGAVARAADRPRILLADDNADLREYVGRLLRGEYQVEAVANGRAALDAARARKPELVLTDMMMPELDGFGLIRELRADPDLRTVPVIVLSARAGEEARLEGLDKGADDYLVKPFSARELLARVDALLRSERIRRETEEAVRASEAHFRNMADTVPAMLWMTDPDASGIFLSRGWYDYTGQTEAEALGNGWTEAIHPEDREEAVRIFMAANERREPFAFDYRLRRKDGEYRWAVDAGRPRFGPNREFLGYIGSVIDVHERKMSEEALRESEDRFRRLADAVPTMIWVSDMTKACTWFNKGWLDFTGRPMHELVGDGWARDVHPEDLDRCLGVYQSHFEARQRFSMEYRLRRHDGQYRWIVDVGIPRFDAGGVFAGYLGSCVDLTERREAEESLAVELAATRRLQETSTLLIGDNDIESLYDRILDTAAAIMQSDFASMQMLHPDRGELELLGCRGFSEEAKQLWQWVGPASGSSCALALQEGRRCTVTDSRTDEYLARSGTRAAYLQAGILAMQSTPLLSRSGRLIGMITTHWRKPHQASERDLRLFDVLARQAADVIERTQTQAQLREADRRKDEFLAMLSHELRNPLAPIRNAVSLLDEADDEPPVRAQARAILNRQVRQLTRLVDDLLDIARISRGSISLRKGIVRLDEIVAAAIETSRPLIEDSSHQLYVDLPKGPIWLSADRVRLTQVISNLLNNAARYTPSGGRIDVIARVADGELSITVRDDGIGIDPAQLKGVFDMFFQAAGGSRLSLGGLGIGLALARQLVELHDGSIEARSEGAGRGSEFVIRMPLPVSAALGSEAAEPRAAESTRRVLVADDNVDAAQSLGLLLRKMGHDVQLSYDGATALEAALREPPEFVLLDIDMPNLDGFAVAARLREDPRFDHVPIVALTGMGQDVDRKRTRQAGFDEHVLKPVEPSALRRALDLVRARIPNG